VTVNGEVSFWWAQRGRDDPRPPLNGPTHADVCIVGAGYTGLWTAYYLKKAAPGLRVVVLEQRFSGFGASGRNGGWLTNSITGGRDRYVRSHGPDAAHRLQVALNDTVDEVIRVAAAEGIDADVVRGGELTVATNDAQLRRLRAAAEAEQRWGDTGVEILGAAEASERVAVAGVLGGTWQPYAARVQPAKLVVGLARAVTELGVEIFEGTCVTSIAPGCVGTDRGAVEARFVVRATEGFTARLAGERRTWLPMNSSMVVTAPLPDDVWRSVGWADREVLGDAAHAYVYAQRTADDRIAIGGRGVPYRFGSRHDVDGTTSPATVRSLVEMLGRLLPATRGAPIEHAWSGVLGVPRDWSATVGLDRATGLAWAGGYVGTGVAATNLAGRTLADLVMDRESELTGLPWVGHRVRRWEPEPLRWAGVRALYTAYRAADRAERRRGSTSPLATLADLVSGRH
jgi:glycine/D-amino acid oxidase-like deaminating enzyme